MTTSTSGATTALPPNYRLAIIITLLGVALCFAQLLLGFLVSVFGLFLIVQTGSIRLIFTGTALEVRRKEALLKTFPYADWESWTLFWPPVPILFYFKEVNSIHFLPILFSPQALRESLEQHCPTLSSHLKDDSSEKA